MKAVKRVFPLFVIVFLAATAAIAGQATQPERWLHVRVDNQEAKGEMVRINVPLSLAEKVLPAIHNDKLRKWETSRLFVRLRLTPSGRWQALKKCLPVSFRGISPSGE